MLCSVRTGLCIGLYFIIKVANHAKPIPVASGYVGTIGGVAELSGSLVKLMRMSYQKHFGFC